ncbi:hypothetical protein HDV62DRAFT_382194 [Trichoderma sp. SZMC 28011]
MAGSFPWSHLIRFEKNGTIYYGNAVFAPGQVPGQITQLAKSGELQAQIIKGDPLSPDATLTTEYLQVEKLLCPLTHDQVPIIRCVGLNYMQHIKEGGRTPPPYPSLFIKPTTCLAAFDADIKIPLIAQETLDYEGELTIVIGKDAIDVPEERALDYIAGYVASNDISCRIWQRDPKYAGNVPQWCFSKGFDSFAPIGPMIVSPTVLGAADNQTLETTVNHDLRQDSNTSDLLFGVRRIVSFLSQGTTLKKGSLIMTGTPSGVALGMKPMPVYLKDGDVVKVEIGGLGIMENKMVFV